MVKEALYTYVRPEESKEPELLAVSERAMRDIGLKPGEEKTEEFKQLVAGNKFFWDEKSGEGIYPWAQCYGGTYQILGGAIHTDGFQDGNCTVDPHFPSGPYL